MYERGYAVARSYATALDWYRKAAEQNYPPAEIAVARFYGRGLGVPRDVSQRNAWLLRAAGQDSPMAQNILGNIYRLGLGVPQDLPTAAQWYQRAAAHEFGPAQARLGLMYLHGRGVKQDYAQSMQLLRHAADKGNPLAQNGIGVLYGMATAYARTTSRPCGGSGWRPTRVTRRRLQSGRDVRRRTRRPARPERGRQVVREGCRGRQRGSGRTIGADRSRRDTSLSPTGNRLSQARPGLRPAPQPSGSASWNSAKGIALRTLFVRAGGPARTSARSEQALLQPEQDGFRKACPERMPRALPLVGVQGAKPLGRFGQSPDLA